jgi:integration host factor subunit beta
MTKSELIDQLAELQRHLAHLDVELGVKSILEQMSASLSEGDRIEIRGFGSFGKALRERVDYSKG